MEAKLKCSPGAPREVGQAAVEMAIVLPVLLALVFGALSMAAWYFAQTAAAVNAANTARAAGVTRGDVAFAHAQSALLLRGALGGTAGSNLAGGTAVSLDPLRRAVVARTMAGARMKLPLLGRLDFMVLAASFTRNWTFAPGPPNPWE